MPNKRHPLLGRVDSRKFKIFREEFPAVFRFDGRLYTEDFIGDEDQEQFAFTEVTPEWADEQLRANFGLQVAEGSNPDTCQHHLISVSATLSGDLFRVCVSCASTVDDSFFNEYDWDFQFDGNCWKRIGRR